MICDKNKRLDYEEAGAAPLLGLKKRCLIAHGSSTTTALSNAIAATANLNETELVDAIEESIGRHSALWEAAP